MEVARMEKCKKINKSLLGNKENKAPSNCWVTSCHGDSHLFWGARGGASHSCTLEKNRETTKPQTNSCCVKTTSFIEKTLSEQ